MAKKRQTFGKMVRERERAEKRLRKQEKKAERKLEAAADSQAQALGYPVIREGEGEVVEGVGPLDTEDAQEPPRASQPAG
jgi:hypothetical protein